MCENRARRGQVKWGTGRGTSVSWARPGRARFGNGVVLLAMLLPGRCGSGPSGQPKGGAAGFESPGSECLK